MTVTVDYIPGLVVLYAPGPVPIEIAARVHEQWERAERAWREHGRAAVILPAGWRVEQLRSRPMVEGDL